MKVTIAEGFLISGSTNFVIADTLISKLPCTPIVPPTLRRSLSKSKLVTLISLRLLTVPNSLNLLAPDNETSTRYFTSIP